MKRMIAGLWSRKNYERSGSTADTRIKALKECVVKLGAQIKQEKIPEAEVQGILVAPEYFFTKPDAGDWDGAAFLARAISQADKEQAVAGFEAISKSFPSMMMIPGTIAWKKPLVRPATEARKKIALQDSVPVHSRRPPGWKRPRGALRTSSLQRASKWAGRESPVPI